MPKTNTVRPSILTIAGSDSAGLAGIQMDTKTQNALGCHSLNIITAVTAQNNEQLIAINAVEPSHIKQQLDAVQILMPSAVKSGLIVNQAQLEVIATTVNSLALPYVCDPVLATTSGSDVSLGLVAAIKQQLMPLAVLITPNIPETEQLSGLTISSHQSIEIAARQLIKAGAQAVYIKGGHNPVNKSWAQDFFCSPQRSFWLSSPKIHTNNTRGTGCAFASAVSSALALGYTLEDAVIIAKMALNQGLAAAYALGDANALKGCVAIQQFPHQQCYLPLLTTSAQINHDKPTFLECTSNKPLGLYPVVDSAKWLARLLPLGISTAQLRNKNLCGEALEQEIKTAIALGKQYNCRVFINDYWQLAIKHGAYGVHLGQEDLDAADIDAIAAAGLRLGVSTHCHYEVARAHALKPSYIACGPVYETTTKDMPWRPHGLSGLAYWQQCLDYPLVAIGGIDGERIKGVASKRVSGIAMITAITLAKEPKATALEFMHFCDEYCV